MVKETYIKEIDKENEILVVSFEGAKEDIYEIRDFVKIINSAKYDYYQGFGNNDWYDEEDDDGQDYENELCDIVSDILEEEEDLVNHPSHYTNSGMECILEMVMLYGFEETMSFCKLNAHKYRKRALDKGGRQDIDKSDWYMNTYGELLVAMETGKSPIQYVLSKMN